MKTTVNVLIVFFVVSNFLFAGIRQNARFSITENDKSLNRYYVISNQFDSTITLYEVGDFAVNTTSNHLPIKLAQNLSDLPGKYFQGNAQNGICNDLSAFLTTENFYVPSNALSISFFRYSVTNFLPCDGGGTGSTNLSGVTDRSQFEMAVIDASTDVVLLKLDSVVSLPTQRKDTSNWVGRNAATTFHTITISPNIRNRTVYIRITPSRYGTTPYGMIIKETKNWINLSVLYDNEGNYISNNNYTDSLNTIFRNRLIQNLDSIKIANGNVVQPEFYPSGFGTVFLSRYYGRFVPYKIKGNDTIFILSNVQKKSSSYDNKNVDKKICIQELYPSIIYDKSELLIKIYSFEDNSIDLNVIDSRGILVDKIFSDKVNKGINTILYKSNNLLEGMYFLQLVNVNNNINDTKKFMMAK